MDKTKSRILSKAEMKEKNLFVKYPAEVAKMFPQLNRIERMLKWLVIQKELEINHQDRLTAGEIQNKEWFEACVERWKKIRKQVPDISDIIEEK